MGGRRLHGDYGAVILSRQYQVESACRSLLETILARQGKGSTQEGISLLVETELFDMAKLIYMSCDLSGHWPSAFIVVVSEDLNTCRLAVLLRLIYEQVAITLKCIFLP